MLAGVFDLMPGRYSGTECCEKPTALKDNPTNTNNDVVDLNGQSGIIVIPSQAARFASLNKDTNKSIVFWSALQSAKAKCVTWVVQVDYKLERCIEHLLFNFAHLDLDMTICCIMLYEAQVLPQTH